MLTRTLAPSRLMVGAGDSLVFSLRARTSSIPNAWLELFDNFRLAGVLCE